MPTITRALAVLAFAIAAALASAASEDAPERFDAELRKVYDYLPTEVDQSVRDAKVAAMDGFWDFVKSDVETYRPLLRAALLDPDQNRYFLYGGAGLLNEIAEGPADTQAAADALGRCSMREVGPTGYFRFVHHLGVKGANATEAALQILDDPKFAVYLPAHALRLGQAQCLQLSLMTMDESAWVPAAVARFASATDKTSRRTLLRCLSYAVHADADAAIRAVAENEAEPDRMLRTLAKGAVRRMRVDAPEGEPTTTREQFEAVLASCAEDGRVPWRDDAQAVVDDALHHVRRVDEALLRRARRGIANRISDESLLELDRLTTWLRRAMTQDE